jgi:predicted regulator of amino acid metabolism with ACT domain
MGRKSVSFEKKVEIAALLKVLPNHSDVARRAKVSRKCVINVAEKIKNGESLENRPGQGR